ncbi:heavy-metal-associated domain-containing protein [Haladaptatus sp. DFWS20]|uniref:heavy-metal-associated domain-containing protein n=1 Tax=Haladaptatus sp. DFWS20 TaxID=3403467 RepID=UPI003EB93459
MEEYILHVTGMSCKSCESMVRDAVTALCGVSSVNPDAQTGEVVIRGEPTTEFDRLSTNSATKRNVKQTFSETPRTTIHS